jgi:hypothetical protein
MRGFLLVKLTGAEHARQGEHEGERRGGGAKVEPRVEEGSVSGRAEPNRYSDYSTEYRNPT